MKVFKKSALATIAGSTFFAASALATIGPIQTEITSSNGSSVQLPNDGSNCNPRVIQRNLEILVKTKTLDVTNLTATVAPGGSCYGACPADLQKALAEHCAKAELLAEIAALIESK